MKNLLLIFIALLFLQHSSAQEVKLELSANRLDNKNIEISYEKSKPGSYTIALKFTNLTNSFQPDESVVSVDGKRGILLTLKPNNKDQIINYNSYKYRYIRGALNPKVNVNFCYIFPYKVGTKVKTLEQGYVNEKYFGAERPSDWNSYLFITDVPDTVTAIRKGIVVDIVDKYNEYNPDDIEYTSKRNQIIVEHEDGTLLRYLGLKRGLITVQLGDDVLPGSVLGINTLKLKSSYSISLLLYYLNSADMESLDLQTLSSPKSLYKILTPKFTLDGTTCDLIENRNEYTVFNSQEIITRELSKKELKKYMSLKEKK